MTERDHRAELIARNVLSDPKILPPRWERVDLACAYLELYRKAAEAEGWSVVTRDNR